MPATIITSEMNAMTGPRPANDLAASELVIRGRKSRPSLSVVRSMLDDCDGVAFGNMGSHLDEMTEHCDKAIAAQGELVEVLNRYMAAYPASRMKPVGAPGSLARIEQENLMALEECARAALSKAGG